jgi:hypothetical protein
MKDQERLLGLVHRQNTKNQRLEEHLSSGLGLDKLKKGERLRDPHYDPLDDLSFEEDEADMGPLDDENRERKRKRAKNKGG